MQRETTKFTVPSGKSIEIKTYLTGREANAIKEVMLKNMKVDVATGQTVGDLSGDFMIEQEKKLIENLIVSIDGVIPENSPTLISTILDLKNDDYQAIVKEINKIFNANLTQAK